MSSVETSAAAFIAASSKGETRHALKLRHKAEMKALLAAPAKGIGAKKAQKDAATALEAEHARQATEFDEREKKAKEVEEAAEAGEQPAQKDGEQDDSSAASSASAAAAAAAPAGGKQLSRAQQKKAKAAQKDAARMAQLREETSGMRDVRGEENAAIAAALTKHTSGAAAAAAAADEAAKRLRVKEMVSDGHCLYRALADQAQAHELPVSSSGGSSSFMSLRRLCAEYMRSHRDEFAPFVLTDEGEPLDDAGWASYLSSLESEQAAVWGGHTEIVALSKALRRPIVVWSADGKMELGEEFCGPAAAASSSASPAADPTALHISFHRHYFGLGNHYNSVVEEEVEEDEDEQPEVGAVTEGVAAL